MEHHRQTTGSAPFSQGYRTYGQQIAPPNARGLIGDISGALSPWNQQMQRMNYKGNGAGGEEQSVRLFVLRDILMNICSCACTHTHAHTCERAHTHIHSHTHTRTHVHTHAHTHTHTHTHTNTNTNTNTHTYTRTHTHTHIHSHRHTYT